MHTDTHRNTKKGDSSFSVVCTASKPPTTTTKPQYVSKHLAIHPLPDRQTDMHARQKKNLHMSSKRCTQAFNVSSEEEDVKKHASFNTAP